MSRIRSRGNKATELELAKLFRANGITGWRRGRRLSFRKMLKAENLKAESGHTRIIRPDFVFLKDKVAVFVDGDFWHGHPTRAKIPKTRRAWWLAKIEGNKARDRRQNRILRKNGWKVVRVWEHELDRKHVHRALRKLRAAGLLS